MKTTQEQRGRAARQRRYIKNGANGAMAAKRLRDKQVTIETIKTIDHFNPQVRGNV